MQSDLPSTTTGLSDTERDTIRSIGDYLYIRHKAKVDAFGCFLWGFVNFLSGLAAVSIQALLGWCLAAFGIFVIFIGVLLRWRPTPLALKLSGTSLITVGTWNLIITATSLILTDDFAAFWLVLGVAQIIWGIKEVRKSSRYMRLSEIAENEKILAGISSAIINNIPQASDNWILNIPNKMRPMSSREISAPLKSHITELLHGSIPLDRAVLHRPGADKSEYIGDIPELKETMDLLNEKTREKK